MIRYTVTMVAILFLLSGCYSVKSDDASLRGIGAQQVTIRTCDDIPVCGSPNHERTYRCVETTLKSEHASQDFLSLMGVLLSAMVPFL